MEISEETLRKSFRAMGDDELLRRWEAQLLTDEAKLIAKAEIDSRGLDASQETFTRLRAEDKEDVLAIKRRQRSTVKGMLFRLFLGIMGVAGAAIAALVLGVGR